MTYKEKSTEGRVWGEGCVPPQRKNLIEKKQYGNSYMHLKWWTTSCVLGTG